MNLTICDSLLPSASAAPAIDPSSLYHALEHVKDGRKARGKRYPLALIFTLLLLGKLAGETTIHGALEWVNLRATWLKQQLDWPRRFPSNATVTRALATCDAEQLVEIVAGVLLKARAQEQQREKEATTPLTKEKEIAGDPGAKGSSFLEMTFSGEFWKVIGKGDRSHGGAYTQRFISKWVFSGEFL